MARPLPLLGALVLAAVAAGAAANHPQAVHGTTVVFDHVKGNEWWVEAKVTSSNPEYPIDAVDARFVGSGTGGTLGSGWHPLRLNQWGVWAGSFHIPPGERVEFLAYQNGGMSSVWEKVSCPFTHPAGVEQCGSTSLSSSSSSSSPSPGGFEAPFTGFRGNEWWVQANVGTNGPAIAKVEVRRDNGPWMPLSKQSWGPTAWAGSYHFPQGSVLQMRATAVDGQTDLSSCRQWIPPSGQDAAIVPCPGTTTTTSPGPTPFDATFTGVKGNDWWVQVNVAANQELKSVAVRVDCEPYWRAIYKQSWGGWAGSFYVPPGSKVDFQARSVTGASDASGGYTWPQATPTSGCPQGNWPRYGSFVEYALAHDVCGGGECFSTDTTLRLVYRDDNSEGAWQGTCVGRDVHTRPDGTQTFRTWTSEAGFAPSHIPWRTQAGAQHQPMIFSTAYGQESCGASQLPSPLTVLRQEDHTTELRDANGNRVTMRTWYGESTNEADNLHAAHWDVDTGLVTDLHSYPRRSQQGSTSMVLVGTDARLS